MYKVFFNNRTVLLTDDFASYFRQKYGLFYKYYSREDLNELIMFYSSLSRIDTLYIFHTDIEKLRDDFRACFLNINAAGGVVRNQEGKVLIIRRRGKWDLPKGKLDKNEDFSNAALREVNEECGLKGLKITKQLISTYHSYMLNDQRVLKKTSWFEMLYTGEEDPVPETEEDITDIRWFNPSELKAILSDTYPAVLDVLIYAKLVAMPQGK